MGAELAVTSKRDAALILNNFVDTTMVKLRLRKGSWAIFGRVEWYNGDGDLQWWKANVIASGVKIDHVDMWAEDHARGIIALQATLKVAKQETVELSCNTYKGYAEYGSLLAIKVDDIEVQ
jgi:hypothetical protein